MLINFVQVIKVHTRGREHAVPSSLRLRGEHQTNLRQLETKTHVRSSIHRLPLEKKLIRMKMEMA